MIDNPKSLQISDVCLIALHCALQERQMSAVSSGTIEPLRYDPLKRYLFRAALLPCRRGSCPIIFDGSSRLVTTKPQRLQRRQGVVDL